MERPTRIIADPAGTAPLRAILDGMPLRAAGFIVTLYGDVVVPRGGEVWIGTIIETCARVGISETLVRTAVSRLVSAGQLEGWRRGRRSFYRLTPQAEAEFDTASRLIYGPAAESADESADPGRWRFVHLPQDAAEAQMTTLERAGYARLRPGLAVGPLRGPAPPGLLSFEAEVAGDSGQLPGFAAQAWDLTPHAEAYRGLLTLFAPLFPVAPALDGAEALVARLLLVHGWRGALLRDPRLPTAALPADWPGHAARTLFAGLYHALSAAADSHVAERFEAGKGRMPGTNAAIETRLAVLHGMAKVKPDQEVPPGAAGQP